MQDRRIYRAQRIHGLLRLFLILALSRSAWASGPVDPENSARIQADLIALQHQPMTEGEQRRIMADLSAMAAGTPDSEAGLAASYLLGRLRQLNGLSEEPSEFQILVEQHPGHPLAELARMKLILRQLYALDDSPPARRLKEAEDMGRKLTLPSLQCDFHLAMGDAYIFYGDQREPALRHLVAAVRLGISSSATRATVLVQIGELARLTGDQALAAGSYKEFLQEFPRDIRQQIVRDRLAAVEAQP